MFLLLLHLVYLQLEFSTVLINANMYTSGARKKKNCRFQVGSFMHLQKSKREQAVEDCGKIKILNMELMASNEKIKEKEKELKAKGERLRRLETKVIAML